METKRNPRNCLIDVKKLRFAGIVVRVMAQL